MTDPAAPRELTYQERATLQDLYAWSARLTDDWLGLGERLRRYADAWKADVDELRAEIERLRQYEPLPGGVPLREVLLQREVERLTRELARYAYPPDHRVSMAEAERDRLREGLEQIARGDYTGASYVAREVLSGEPASVHETTARPRESDWHCTHCGRDNDPAETHCVHCEWSRRHTIAGILHERDCMGAPCRCGAESAQKADGGQ